MAAAVLAGGLIALHVQAADSAPPPAQFRGRLLERAKEKLGLTSDQIAQIKSVLKADKDTLTHTHARATGAVRTVEGATASLTARAGTRPVSAQIPIEPDGAAAVRWTAVCASSSIG